MRKSQLWKVKFTPNPHGLRHIRFQLIVADTVEEAVAPVRSEHPRAEIHKIRGVGEVWCSELGEIVCSLCRGAGEVNGIEPSGPPVPCPVCHGVARSTDPRGMKKAVAQEYWSPPRKKNLEVSDAS